LEDCQVNAISLVHFSPKAATYSEGYDHAVVIDCCFNSNIPLQMLAEAVRTASQIPQGFKELIQKRCEERGIVFIPLPNRYREGKQIYRCGKIQIYIDRSVVFVSDNGTTWSPTSLNNMLDMAV